ncbi:MAG: RidA family protein [Acidobacteriota bacterium]|nr:RidA family protein [Acidobacteriota bacterium]
MSYEIFNPSEMPPARGFSHGLLAPAGGRVLFIAGQTAHGTDGAPLPQSSGAEAFVGQFAKALDNVLAVAAAAGGRPEHLGRFTVYVTDMATYRSSLKALGDVYRQRMGRHFPAMALVAVSELVDPGAMVEIEATAVLPT